MPPLSRDPTAAYPISEDTSIPPEERTTLWICSYTRFDNLAHAPRGTPSDHSLHTIHLDERTGALHRHSTVDGVLNPAFLRFHPKGVVYALTESIHENGEIVGFTTDAAGGLSPLCRQSAHGLSTCFLHLTTNLEHVLFVNYWDSSLGVCPVKPDGVIAEKVYLQAPAKVHAGGLADHLANRQSEPHAHAIVVDPTHGRIACVPDLGLDKIRLYTFDPQSGQLASIGELPCCSGPGPHGPRYIEFDRPGFGTHYRHSAKRERSDGQEAAFVVNELSSSVSLFKYDSQMAARLLDGDATVGPADLFQLVQVVSTLPSPVPPPSSFTGGKNTCGRIAQDPSGKFVLVSNRGDDSICVYKIDRDAGDFPALVEAGVYKTEGKTPRHFQFSPTGKFVIAACQDSDHVTVFAFDPEDGSLKYTGNKLAIDSPNFVCAQPRPPPSSPSLSPSTSPPQPPSSSP